MKTYMFKRLMIMIPTLIGSSLLIFFLFALTPGDYVDTNPKLSPERKIELKALYGLDKPIIERYFVWAGNVLRGDLGYSLQYQQPVTTILGQYIWSSFLIAITSTTLTWIIAISIGVFSASRQYSWFDSLVTIGVFAAMALPAFFVGLLAIKIFAVDLKILPPGGILTTGSNATGLDYVIEVMKHMILPVTVLTMLSVGSLTRYFRTNILEVIRQDFIRTARAKGLKEKVITYKHALRNALLPAITLLGFELPALFGGAIITEKIFNWPGVGQVYMQALSLRDYPLLMGFTMFIALLTVVSNLLADLLYGVVDPRVRLK
ncbi:ABC transporter permease [Brevibacillus sp. 7WMA2]|uniref:Dipeptide transport system permease protein DppB n=1 Tax=Brevibacillus laterosporus LMG 15441 TaxID=1042163 RepID=A0A075R2C3_BRELA|nr:MULTISPECIES: ABC transporter permease [Brevibacillus]AIG26722.1 dipeptide transport system permease protein DppB [Brevibacillus laterosporus LMG 15441]AUM65208.1 ABC transporter permease [Brevibacillus laterosporus]AYK08218.1 ABC transporter permease [Brevibacillus laterosporus]ERM18950.1 peptide ABC transporter permease [Brevibacillus laterosporus PE36]MBA4532727.1 ABC transporter permease [Brevibacillus halotolerans]